MVWFVRTTGAYLVDMLPGLLLAAAAFAVCRPFRLRRLERRGLSGGRGRERLVLALWLYSGSMAALTLLPPGFGWLSALRYGYPIRFFRRGTANWIPFQTLGESLYILLGNVVMFLPFGFLAALAWRGFTARRAAWTGLLISGGIECWQYFAVGRSFDIDDLMFNTLGVLCGYGLWRLIARRCPALGERFWLRTLAEEPKSPEDGGGDGESAGLRDDG